MKILSRFGRWESAAFLAPAQAWNQLLSMCERSPVSAATNPAIVEAIRSSRRDLARLITRIVDNHASRELAALYPFTGNAHIIGVTGSPGTGKSSLVNVLAKHYRSENRTVGI